MPTVFVAAGFAVRIYPNDHGPPHVHVWRAGGWIALTLPSDRAGVSVLRTRGMKHADMVGAVRIVEENASILWGAWRRFHGQEVE